MYANELGRILGTRGASASAVDQAVRSLRKATHLPLAGRGAYAVELTPSEACLVVICLARSEIAARADQTLLRLKQISGGKGARLHANFISAFEQLVTEDRYEAAVVRVGRIHASASIEYVDGHIDVFGEGLAPPGFRTEGIILGSLIADLKAELAG